MHGATIKIISAQNFIFVNGFDILSNTSFEEHLPEDGHNMAETRRRLTTFVV
jgi:hypothetical protein